MKEMAATTETMEEMADTENTETVIRKDVQDDSNVQKLKVLLTTLASDSAKD
jgi:hypothetical protein